MIVCIAGSLSVLFSHSCWVSTGTFPQSFTLSLQATCQVQEVAIETYNGDSDPLLSSIAISLQPSIPSFTSFLSKTGRVEQQRGEHSQKL